MLVVRNLKGESAQRGCRTGARVLLTGAGVGVSGELGEYVSKDGVGIGVVTVVGDGGVPHEHFPSSGMSRGAHCTPSTQGSQLLIPLKLHESVQGLLRRP